MVDSFYIGAYWSSRAEPLQQVSDRISQTLKKLAEIDQQFLNWYEGGLSRKEALGKKVIFNNETIEKICLEKVKKGELDKNGFAKMGFLFGLWTGHPDDESSSVSFNVGTASKWLSNSCVINIPSEGLANRRLLQSEKVRAIISILIEIWKPDYAFLTSNKLVEKLDDANEIGWITYRKSVKHVPKSSDMIICEKFHDGYLFTVSTYGEFDVDKSIEALINMN